MSAQPREPSPEDVAYRAALQRAETLRAYYTHLLLYLVVVAVAYFVNLLTRGDDGSWWFYWPLAVWGIAIAIHTLVVFGPVFSQDWKLRKADEIYRRGRDSSSQT
jgi:2TM domain-containing protein